MWCIPPEQSAAFVSHMEDVLDVYQQPADPRRPLVCLDETSLQLIGEVRTPRPVRRGRPARYDSEYIRHGTANLFLAFAPLTGQRVVKVTERRCRGDFARFVRDLVDGPYAEAERIVLVMDQLNTHATTSLYEAFPPREARRIACRLEIHHTPKHGSWLNMAEIELSVLRRDLPERIARRDTLDRHVAAWQQRRNTRGVGADWRFTTKDARIKLRKLYPTTEP
ncbi:hypothetical protein JCM2811A_23660 [Methylorubrum rhodinum]